MKYRAILNAYKRLGVDYGADRETINWFYDHLVYLYQTEAYALHSEWGPLVPETLRRLEEARSYLLSLGPIEIMEAREEWIKAGKPGPEQDARRATVFISYAREDEEAAEFLCQELRLAGVAPWIDKEHLYGGQKWREAIAREIRKSDYFVALLSSAALDKRGFVHQEIRIALEVLETVPAGRIYLIPARLEACEPRDPRLKELHWVDLFPEFEPGFCRIVDAIRYKEEAGRAL